MLGMPVYRLLHEMPHDELLGWIAYFEDKPFGWREDSRTFKLLQAQGVKAQPGELFPSLVPIYNPKKEPEKKDAVDTSSLKNSVFFQLMTQAKGGDKLDVFGE